MKKERMESNSTLIALSIVKKFQDRKKYLDNLPARWLTEKEYREWVRLRDLEKKFLH